METSTKEVFSEMLSILDMLEPKYANRIPKDILDVMERERAVYYNPKYDRRIPLMDQKVKKETIALLALIHLNYWCESEKEKEELQRLFEENEKYLKDRYSYDNLFNNGDESNSTSANSQRNMTEYKVDNILMRIINRINSFFHNIRKN